MRIFYEDILRSLYKRFKDVEVDRTNNPKFGDYYTNLAFKLTKTLKKSPKIIADEILKWEHPEGFRVINRNGYINFFVEDDGLCGFINDLYKNGSVSRDLSFRVLVEFISANPTGPLNVANARAGAIGDTIVRILKFLGFKVESEYYVNDSGSQIINLALSVLHHINPERYEFPEDGYRGEYIKELALEFKDVGGINGYEEFGRKVAYKILETQKSSLKRYGIKFDRFVFESEIRKSRYPQMVMDALSSLGLVYYLDKDGRRFEFRDKNVAEIMDRCREGVALVFKSSEFGDDKDRVLIRSNGQPTYFFWDSAYHLQKMLRNYNAIVDIWGPDHYGYVPRMKAMVESLSRFYNIKVHYEVVIHGQVNLYEGKKGLRMSKREGRIFSLDDLVDEVGKDAARFFMLMRAPSTELVELAKKAEKDNPVYYTQYAHARIKGLIDYALNNNVHPVDIKDFHNEDERNLARTLQFFPYYVLKTLPLPLRKTYTFGYTEGLSAEFSPNLLVDYLIELSHLYHRFYQNNRIVGSGRASERLALSIATMRVLEMGLYMIGVSAPDRMVKED